MEKSPAGSCEFQFNMAQCAFFTTLFPFELFLHLLHSVLAHYKWKRSWLIYQPQTIQRAGLDVKHLIISHRSLQENIVSTWFSPETWYLHCFLFRLSHTQKHSHPPYTHCVHSLYSAHLI